MDILSKIDKLMIDEGVYGKKKSKEWFHFRTEIAKVADKKMMRTVFDRMQKSLESAGLTKDEFDDLVNMAMKEKGKVF